MCLATAVESPDRVLEKGEFADHEFIITHNYAGGRCGYVKVEPGHPWHGVNYDSLQSVLVHGGLTFSQPDIACEAEGSDNGWWLGFDFAHFGRDAADPTLPMTDEGRRHAKAINEAEAMLPSSNYMLKSWTHDEVRGQCRLVCKQAQNASINALVR